MPQSCHRCGNLLEEGVAFCPICGAPQIRVTLPEPDPEEIAATLAPPAPTDPKQILWSRGFLAAFLPAIGVIFLLAISAFFTFTFPVWAAAAGYTSVLLYRRRAPLAPISTAIGTRLGAVTGVCCFGLQLLLMLISFVAQTASGQNVRAELMKQIRDSIAKNPNADAVRFAQDFLSRPDAFLILVVISLTLLLVGFLLAATLGGAVSGALESRKVRAR